MIRSESIARESNSHLANFFFLPITEQQKKAGLFLKLILVMVSVHKFASIKQLRKI